MTINVTMNAAQVFRPGQCEAHFHVHNIIKSNVSPPERVLWPDVGVGRIITNHYYLNSNFQSLFIIATRSSWGDLGTHHSQPAPALQHRVRSLSDVDSESINVSINICLRSRPVDPNVVSPFVSQSVATLKIEE